MKQANDFMADMIDFEAPGKRLWRACTPTALRSDRGEALLDVPFQALVTDPQIAEDASIPRRLLTCRVRAYSPDVVRFSLEMAAQEVMERSPMLELSPEVRQEDLTVRASAPGWEAVDGNGRVRMRVTTGRAPVRHWSDLIPASSEPFDVTVLPDGVTSVPFMALDQFFPGKIESLPIGMVTAGPDGDAQTALFALHAAPNEHFAGTGERFMRMDLAGHTFILENVDGLGVNNRRAYKNVPFLLSSRRYGIFLHTSSHVRLSVADVSTRAVQAAVEEPVLDLFFIGGGSLERVLYGYRSLTGFPAEPPLWSYGTWMSRMTYFSAEEVRHVASRLRREQFPCDVLHLDTGWFEKDWVCEWRFSGERFPDPAGFMAEMRGQGYRITLWQNPLIGKGNVLLPLAQAKGYLPRARTVARASASDLGAQGTGSRIDFTNPAAVAWYQSLLSKLFALGASAIKTDFGEVIDMDADYFSLPAERLHNLYALLYQRAAFEETVRSTGDSIIWARSAWAGCQRYPLHWGGDCASTWDGMAGSLRGGLHLGLSGFGFWSHDVPGFHGVPEFMNSRPSDALYVRWTQFGVFTSHLRYHGASPREPYEYPAVQDTVRKWLRLRYALIPYFLEQGHVAASTGFPVLRALVLQNEDPVCWTVDDQFYSGGAFLVAPVMNDEGTRDVYLPDGEWVDLWDGAVHGGGRWLRGVVSPLEHMPVYARRNAKVPIYPQRVSSTAEMDLTRVELLRFDGSYRGIAASRLGPLTEL